MQQLIDADLVLEVGALFQTGGSLAAVNQGFSDREAVIHLQAVNLLLDFRYEFLEPQVLLGPSMREAGRRGGVVARFRSAWRADPGPPGG